MDKVIGKYVTVYYRPMGAPPALQVPFIAVIVGDKLRDWYLMIEEGTKFRALKGACSSVPRSEP